MKNTRILELYIESFGNYTNVKIKSIVNFIQDDNDWVDIDFFDNLSIEHNYYICLDGKFKKFKRRLLIKGFIENEVG
jgi:hypothetical protein